MAVLAAPDAEARKKNGFDLDGSLVPAREIRKGGPPRDGIPALDDPTFVAAGDADYLEPGDRILGVEVSGVAKAYPIRILNYHEIVNDRIGDAPFVVTYCPLCGSGVVFDARVDGRALEFGVSGLLYNSDVLLYDRPTESLWSQLKRQAVTGPMRGKQLEMMPVAHTTWRDWQARHPDTAVLSARTGYRRNYNVDPYPGYSNSGRIYFPVDGEDDRYPRKTIVMGVEVDGRFKAYPFPELEKTAGRIEDRFMGKELVVVFDEANRTATALDADGEELATTMAFWFAWYAFHPETEVFTAGEGS